MVASDFLNRVTSYPLVSSAYERASASITWAKDRSTYARTAAGIAESGLRRVAEGAAPLLSRYESRIADLDRLACRQLLDRLESACPTVLQPTEKVVERGRSYYSESVKPKVEFVLSPVTATVAKVQSAKSASLERYRQAVASRQGQAGLRQFDQLVQLLSDCVDKCLPPAEKEKHSSEESSSTGKDEARGDAGKGESGDTPADPSHSIALAYELGRKVSVRVSDRVTDRAGRLVTAGHRLVERVIGRSPSPDVSSTGASSDSSNLRPPPASSGEAGDETDDAEESQLDRSDMSTD